VNAQPIGYIEVKDNLTRFVSISKPVSYPTIILAAGIASYFILKGLGKFIRNNGVNDSKK
jgi:hypothetical protein